jgi:hypothetical protein
MSSINLFFVRHGFAQHNEAPTHEIPDPYAISDPKLTKKGIELLVNKLLF